VVFEDAAEDADEMIDDDVRADPVGQHLAA
jgi:hypothetical protein